MISRSPRQVVIIIRDLRQVVNVFPGEGRQIRNADFGSIIFEGRRPFAGGRIGRKLELIAVKMERICVCWSSYDFDRDGGIDVAIDM